MANGLPANLKRYRTLKNLSMRGLCAKLEEEQGLRLNQYWICRYENGRSIPKPHIAEAICKVLGITTEELFAERKNAVEKPAPKEKKLSATQEHLKAVKKEKARAKKLV